MRTNNARRTAVTGIGSTVIDNITVGAGAVVVANMPDVVLIVGGHAKIVKANTSVF